MPSQVAADVAAKLVNTPDFLRWWALRQWLHSAEQWNDGVQQLLEQISWRGTPSRG